MLWFGLQIYMCVCVFVPRDGALSFVSEELFGVFCAGFALKGGGLSGSCIQM